MLELNSLPDEFFHAGGSVPPKAAYVERTVDQQLYTAVLAGKYCNVLAPRQAGKSSLMERTINVLKQQKICTVRIDLTKIGADDVTSEQWYYSLLSVVQKELGLTIELNNWWQSRSYQSTVQRFSEFMRQEVLEKISEPVVIFIDEIDSTLKLPFTDDFFAAIRAMYNSRANDSIYNRLTFVLLGVAYPAYLIKDRTRTPYNIGQAIDLKDFTSDEAQSLLPGLERVFENDQATAILQRVLYWTDGHPYLTQKICQEIVKNYDNYDGRTTIDKLVESLFMSDEARKNDINISPLYRNIQESENREELVRLYYQILTRETITDEELNLVKSQLKLTGLVKTTSQGALAVRNRIYAHIFDRQWIKQILNLPTIPKSITLVSSVIVALLTILFVTQLPRWVATETPQPSATTDPFEIPTTVVGNTATPPLVDNTPTSTSTLVPTPTPISTSTLLTEINFAQVGEGDCNNYDSARLGYENQQYYINPHPASGYIAICHSEGDLESKGILQVSAYPEEDPAHYGFGVLFGWAGGGTSTTDACIVGIRRVEHSDVETVFIEASNSQWTGVTLPVNNVELGNESSTLQVALTEQGVAQAYLNNEFIGEYKFSNCANGPIGLIAWNLQDGKIYFDDFKVFDLP